MAFILINPGVYLREISEDLALPMGVVEYHLWVLTKEGRLEDCKTGRYRRFFGAGKYQEFERTVLSLLRQGTAGRTLVALSGAPVTHTGLAKMLGVSSQALSWHMRRLGDMGMIETMPSSCGTRLYRLADPVRALVRAREGTVRMPKTIQVSPELPSRTRSAAQG